MAMASSTLHLLLFLLFMIIILSSLTVPSASHGHHAHSTASVNEACSVTRYRSLCVHTLSSFSHSAAQRRSMRWWTQAAVSATQAETERTLHDLEKLRSDGARVLKGHWAKEALSDCIDCLGDATRQLRQSTAELRHLNYNSEFWFRMNNIQTWVSSALTNQDTCNTELGGMKGSQVGTIRSKLLNATYCTSNALALINKVASDGGS